VRIVRAVVEAVLQPRGPYSLALSARGDATRRARDGHVRAALPGGGVALAWQRADRRVVVRATSDEAVDQMRFVLGLDDDHTPFLRAFARDPLLKHVIARVPWLRPMRRATVAHALLRAFCGQLIAAREARRIEWRVIAAACAKQDDLRLPPTCDDLARLSPARLRALGLHARRGAGLIRICRTLELERLKTLPTATVAERLERERGLGPWSVGVVCLEGLGRPERGLVGDLALVKLCAALWGKWVEGPETAELLAPYGEWQGLASVYLMTGFGRGLIPGAVHSPDDVRQSAARSARRWEDRRGADRGPAARRVARAL
jgi:AraC family transcriptional regulator of adaptative response / DNA-3-methyladenine glycosylase II